MTESADKKIMLLVDEIVRQYQPEQVFLFGSFAWGNPTVHSDIDLLVVKRGGKSMLEMARDVYRIIFRQGEATDVLVYTPEQLKKREQMGDPFVLRILNEGKLLYGTR